MPLTPGTRLGSYEVLSPLGAGGMGEVYRARDTRLGRDVAIKLLPETLASSPDRLARFDREAKTVAGLNHPNIVTLHTIEEAGGVRFLVMELVEGRDLSTVIAPGGLPLPQVLDVAIPLADALVAAHERRVVHRDLKPANVMLTRDARVKVLDFGLAKLMEIGADLELTHAATVANPISEVGQVLGTVAYMAPEQIRGEEVDARTDIFSFGILLYELASGKRPFAGQSAADLSSSILRDSPPALSSVRTGLPPDLERIVERCLEKNPRERFQTALDVANELRGLKRATERKSSPSVAKPLTEEVASVAVLPFVNRSASADDEYFSDGLADELLNVLAKIRGLRVAGRTSSFQFKGRNEDTAVIGQKLHVATLLEGSVRKAGNRVRISVQLLDANDGHQLWSETYDRTLDDIFEVQDDIARSVVKELRSALLGEEHDSKASGEVKAEVARAAQGRETDPKAYALYLQARALSQHATVEAFAKSDALYRQVLEIDPRYAPAWDGLARNLLNEVGSGLLSVQEGFSRAREAAQKALSIDADYAPAWGRLGWIAMYADNDLAGAARQFERALALDPTNPTVLDNVTHVLMSLGRLDEAILLREAIVRRDPVNVTSIYNLAYNQLCAGRHDAAIASLRTVLSLSPGRGVAHDVFAMALLLQGDAPAALAEMEQETIELWRMTGLPMVYHALGRKADSDQALATLIAKYEKGGPYNIAYVYAFRGEADKAFEWLDKAVEYRDPGIAEIVTERLFDNIRSDPRWLPFLRKLGKAPEQLAKIQFKVTLPKDF